MAIATFTPKLTKRDTERWQEALARGYLSVTNPNSDLSAYWCRHCLMAHQPFVMVIERSSRIHSVAWADSWLVPDLWADPQQFGHPKGPQLTPEARARLADFVGPRIKLTKHQPWVPKSILGPMTPEDAHEVAVWVLALMQDLDTWADTPRFINGLVTGKAEQLAQSFAVYGVPIPDELRDRLESEADHAIP